TEIAVGNVLGFVIYNMGLIFGAIIIIKSVPINIESFLNRALFMLVSGATVVVLSIDGKLTWHEGILLILIFIGFLYYNYRLQASIFKKSKKLNSNTKERQDIFKLIKTRFHEISKDILLFIVGAGGVIIGSRLLVDSGVKIAQWLGIPELIIGLTLFALGTSLPELITAITATMKGHQEISLGNILGANTMNLTFVLGFCSFINPLEINAQLFEYDFIVMIGLMILLLIFGTTRNLFSKKEGLALLGIYIAYVIGLFVLYG
ncbi:MAG: sodium:calcium antiporter, partial [Methanosarcinales archaeon]|nr:sodium:calcium antiporter [Methanosarcinales archaeon]